jgi:hypothetical protein
MTAPANPNEMSACFMALSRDFYVSQARREQARLD